MGTWKAAPAGLVWCLAVCCGVSGLSLNCAAELPDSPGATVSQSQTAPDQKMTKRTIRRMIRLRTPTQKQATAIH